MPRATKEKKGKKAKNKVNNKNKNNNIEKNTKDEKFSFDEEIVIGLRRIDDEPQKKTDNKNANNNKKNKLLNKNKGKKNNNKSYNKRKVNKKERNKSKKENTEESDIIIKSKYMQNYEEVERPNYHNTKQVQNDKRKYDAKNKNSSKQQKKLSKRKKLVIKIIKWLTLIGIIAAGIIYAMLSPIFNIKEISVVGNSKISSETIISLSELNIDQNIFRFRTSNIIENIKQNAYIDSVDISRRLPDSVEIVVKEREATYMITLGNAYVYINNQGYILEITSTKGEYPLLVGYETPQEQIVEGNRLSEDDLKKLGDVLRIMEAISSVNSSLAEDIAQINISDKTNYIITLDSEKKEIYLGDTNNLSTKILWINSLLEEEKGNEGIIYLNVDLNTERPYFREKV